MFLRFTIMSMFTLQATQLPIFLNAGGLPSLMFAHVHVFLLRYLNLPCLILIVLDPDRT